MLKQLYLSASEMSDTAGMGESTGAGDAAGAGATSDGPVQLDVAGDGETASPASGPESDLPRVILYVDAPHPLYVRTHMFVAPLGRNCRFVECEQIASDLFAHELIVRFIGVQRRLITPE